MIGRRDRRNKIGQRFSVVPSADRQIGKDRQAGLKPELETRRETVGVVERSRRQIDMLALEIIIEQRRVAIRAEAAPPCPNC